MKAIVTVGLGFGDEGKGATVDYLVRKYNAPLVVRYNGGYQAAHNVVLPNGREHVFAQIGAGKFSDADTYIGPNVIVNIQALWRELEVLKDTRGTVYAHPRCLVATPIHVYQNKLQEIARGLMPHGSCCLGIGATREYWLQYGRDALVLEDFVFSRSTGRVKLDLYDKVALHKQRTVARMAELGETLKSEDIDPGVFGERRELWYDELYKLTNVDVSALVQYLAGQPVPVFVTSEYPKDLAGQTVIFEGAQGVLLDEWNGFHPNTTWSTTTPHHAFEIMREWPQPVDYHVMGVTRSYITRHGYGPLPTEQLGAIQGADIGNTETEGRGAIRSGPLDLQLLQYAYDCCNEFSPDSIAATCFDQTGTYGRYCDAYSDRPIPECPHKLEFSPPCLRDHKRMGERLLRAKPVEKFGELIDVISQVAPVSIVSNGRTHADRHQRQDIQFRRFK